MQLLELFLFSLLM